LAIFVHGDFWHRCPFCDLPLPRTHTEFWESKLERNVQRDANKVAELEQAGWKVLIFWEHEVKKDAMQCALRIKENIDALDHATSH
jgi:DNA mismatch endonuclease (patch repair protein)